MEIGTRFGIVAEGFTDQIVITHILDGFFKGVELDVRPLQPKENEPGNWDKVFKYCESSDFEGAFLYLDLVVIQIDTDFMRRGEVSERYKINMPPQMPTKDIVMAFKNKLIALMREGVYEKFEQQIIFAISVDEIECWFLPIYFPDQQKKYAKTTNCIDTLNPALQQKEGFFIDNKKSEYYEKIVKHFRKRKDIEIYASKNESFQLFIDELKLKENSESV